MFFTPIDWDLIRNGYEQLFGGQPTTLYGLPKLLLEALTKESPSLMTNTEMDFELKLADVLQQHHAVAIQDGRPLHSGLLVKSTPITVSSDDFDALGWGKYGLSLEKVNKSAAQSESRAAPFHEQLMGYAGWLITNRQFLDEVTSLRTSTPSVAPAPNSDGSILIDPQMNEFLGRWQLSGMCTWDLPEPQGPNLSGIETPAAADRGAPSVSLDLPLSVRLPAASPICELITEIRDSAAEDHLTDWQDVLRHKSADKFGVQQFSNIFPVHFFRNIVLNSRYGTRFPGRVMDIDMAFATYLNRSEESVKKLRLKIDQRLSPDSQ